MPLPTTITSLHPSLAPMSNNKQEQNFDIVSKPLPENPLALLNLDPWNEEERSLYDNDAIRDALRSNPDLARQQFDFNNYKGRPPGVGEEEVYPIFPAISLGASYDVIELLCNACPEAVDATDEDGWTPLHEACRFHAPLEVVQLLVERNQKGLMTKDEYGKTPLFVACMHTAPTEVVQFLVRRYPEGVRVKEDNQCSPLPLTCGMHMQCTSRGGTASNRCVSSVCQRNGRERMDTVTRRM